MFCALEKKMHLLLWVVPINSYKLPSTVKPSYLRYHFAVSTFIKGAK